MLAWLISKNGSKSNLLRFVNFLSKQKQVRPSLRASRVSGKAKSLDNSVSIVHSARSVRDRKGIRVARRTGRTSHVYRRGRSFSHCRGDIIAISESSSNLRRSQALDHLQIPLSPANEADIPASPLFPVMQQSSKSLSR